MPKQPSLDYQTLSTELEIILEALQRPDIGVDEAVTLYEQGLKLVAALEKHLKQAENKITALKLEADGQGKSE
jgi:exodeoxyribonuclease VII small subunit